MRAYIFWGPGVNLVLAPMQALPVTITLGFGAGNRMIESSLAGWELGLRYMHRTGTSREQHHTPASGRHRRTELFLGGQLCFLEVYRLRTASTTRSKRRAR
jgi:hypothetical protein